MRFLQSYIHRGELRALSASQRPDVLLTVECPRCGLWYFGCCDARDSARAQWRLENQAMAHLDGECPDHGHRFEVRT